MTTSQPVEITPLAIDKLEDVLQKEQADWVRIMAVPGPNGGFQYALSVETAADKDDSTYDISRIKVLIDHESEPLVEGAMIDYVEGLMRSGFTISNPNYQTGGGCGGGT